MVSFIYMLLPVLGVYQAKTGVSKAVIGSQNPAVTNNKKGFVG